MNTNETDKDIIEKLLNGWTLKTLMEPDSSIETNGLAHLENLTLRNIIVKDNIFWGYTSHHHLSISSTDYFLQGGAFRIISFLYSNFGGKRFLSTVSEEMNTHEYFQGMLSLSRYKFHHWILVNDHEEIFSSMAQSSKALAQDAIRNNEELKCAFRKSTGHWYICNIHIPYFVYQTDKVYLQSEPAKIQPAFLHDDFIQTMEERGEALASQIKENGGIVVDGPLEHAQYVIDLDGYYTDMRSQFKKEWLKATDIKVFKRKLPKGTEKIQY